MVENGFPTPLESFPGCGYIDKAARRYSAKQPDDESMRICANCSKEYYVSEAGFPVEENKCSYHWGKLRRYRG